MRSLLLRTFGVVLVLSAAACSDAPTAPAAPGLAGALQANADYSTFVELATATGVLSTLEAGGPYTVLAPTDLAFVYLGTDAGPALTAPGQRSTLERVLRHHIVAGALQPDDFVDGAVLTSLEGSPLRVRRIGDIVLIDGATIDLGERVEADNGILYPASNVIRTNLTSRERVELAPSLSVFSLFSARVGLLNGQDDVTLLVPTNDAFRAIDGTRELLDESRNADVLGRVLRTHVLRGRVDLESLEEGAEVETAQGTVLRVSRAGGVLRIGDVRVVGSPVDTADGRIYLLQDVLFRGILLADRIRIEPRVTVFPGRLRDDAEVWARLNDPTETLTVFVPFDGAYVRQNGDVALALAQPENAALLQRTQRVHVVEGRYAPEDLTQGTVLQALDGSELLVQRNGSDIFIGGRKVTPAGADAANGAFYTAPDFIAPQVDLYDTAILSGYTRFVNLVRRAGLESFYRSASVSVFAPTNAVVNQIPELQTLSPGALRERLQYHTTEAELPLLLQTPQTFAVLSGRTRSIQILPFDRATAPFLDGRDRVSDTRTAYNGTGRLYGVEGFSAPPQ